MNSKLEAIKNRAKKPAAAAADYTKELALYKKQIAFIQDEFNADDKLIEDLKKAMLKQKASILKNPDLSGQDKNKQIREAFTAYMVECAKLNRVGKSIVFFDKAQAKYIEAVTVIKKDEETGEEKEDHIIDYREGIAIRKMIQKEAKRIIGNILAKTQESIILEWIDPYIKTYAPKQKKLYGDYFNVYTPNGFLEVKVNNVIDLDNFVDNIMPQHFPLIDALFKNLAAKEEERKYLINWLSYILNTAQKTRNAIAIIGIQGSGKGVLKEQLIEYALHPDNSHEVSNQDIASTFNSYIENKLFLFFNEIKGNFKESSTQADKIKPFITDSRISVNEKHRKQMYIENHANCMFFSNHDLPFQIEDKDRRYSVIKTEHKTLIEVARERFNLEIGKYIDGMQKERDDFLIMLKMLKHNEESEKLALSLLDNEVKRKIKEQTNTVKEILKEKILDRDVEWFDDVLSEAIEGIENDRLKMRDVDKVVPDAEDGETIQRFPEIHPYTNAMQKDFFLQEIEQGIFTNGALKWFTKIYDVESANSDHKFGKFWNLITNKSDKFTILENGHKKDIRLRLMDVERAGFDTVYINGEQYEIKEGTGKTLVRHSLRSPSFDGQKTRERGNNVKRCDKEENRRSKRRRGVQDPDRELQA